MLTALAFMIFTLASYSLALARGPFWGLFAYANLYFNPANPRLNWWTNYLPFDQWLHLTYAVLLLSLFIHRDKLSSHKFANVNWVFVFFALSTVITMTVAVDKQESYNFLFYLFTYLLIVYILIRSIREESQLRLFLLAVVVFAANLSIEAYLHGSRVNGRLEGVGSADANGSNEFSLLLAAIIPLIFVFLKDGKRYEKIIALVSLPFILNAFILCSSRGATVALVGGLGVATMLVADNYIRKRMALLMIAIIPVFLYLTDAVFIERLSSLARFDSALEDESQADQLSTGRLEIWGYGIQMAKDHPLGIGLNGFKKMARHYMPREVLSFRRDPVHGTRAAHNTYLQVLVEQGIIGLCVWLLLGLHTSLILMKSFKLVAKLKSADPFWKSSVFAMNVAFFSILIGGLVTSRVYYEYFWWQVTLAAIVYSLVVQMVNREVKEANDSVEAEKLGSHKPQTS